MFFRGEGEGLQSRISISKALTMMLPEFYDTYGSHLPNMRIIGMYFPSTEIIRIYVWCRVSILGKVSQLKYRVHLAFCAAHWDAGVGHRYSDLSLFLKGTTANSTSTSAHSAKVNIDSLFPEKKVQIFLTSSIFIYALSSWLMEKERKRKAENRRWKSKSQLSV